MTFSNSRNPAIHDVVGAAAMTTFARGPYSTPTLTVYGDVVRITAAVGKATLADGGGPTSNNKTA